MKNLISILFTFTLISTPIASAATPDVSVSSSPIQCSYEGPINPNDYFFCVYFPRYENFIWNDGYSEVNDSFYPLQNSNPPASSYFGPFYEISIDSGCTDNNSGGYCHSESYNDIYIQPNTTLSHVIIAHVHDDPDYSNNLLVDTFKVLEDGSIIPGYSENNYYNNFYNSNYNNNFNNEYNNGYNSIQPENTNQYYFATLQKETICHSNDGINYIQVIMTGNHSKYPYRDARFLYLSGSPEYYIGSVAQGFYRDIFSPYDIIPPSGYNNGYNPNMAPEIQNIITDFSETQNWTSEGQAIWKNNCNQLTNNNFNNNYNNGYNNGFIGRLPNGYYNNNYNNSYNNGYNNEYNNGYIAPY